MAKEKNCKTGFHSIPGKIVPGYQVASGAASDCPYPHGSIKPQLPLFKERGLDLSHCYPGTLNIDISPACFAIVQPDYCFRSVCWFEQQCEDFSFVRCEVVINDKIFPAWIYYPHPETKPNHFHSAHLIEVIAPHIPDARYGASVTINFAKRSVIVEQRSPT